MAMADVLTSTQLNAGIHVSGEAPAFTFGASGDFGFDSGLNLTLGILNRSPPDFFIALGDFSYHATTPQAWCNAIKAKFNNIELLTGNHEEDQIDQFAQACPFTLNGLTAGSDPQHTYGYEYYFDYPPAQPLARFILISPDISFSLPSFKQTWNYTLGNVHYNFVKT